MIFLHLFFSDIAFTYTLKKNHNGNPSVSGGGNENVWASNSGTSITTSDPSFGQDKNPTVKF